MSQIKQMLDEIKGILNGIGKNDSICIIHHDDADGCTSAALFSILIKNLIGDYPLLFPIRGEENISRGMLNQMKIINPDYVFVLDVSIDARKLNLFKGFILDHHIFNDFPSNPTFKYFNPRVFEKDDEKILPVSYMTYKLLKEMFPQERVAWIAAIGITEDHRVELCRDVFEDVRRENPDLLGDQEITQIKIENSIFGQFWDMVRSGRMIRKTEGARTAVLALIETKDRPDKFFNGLTQHSFALRNFYDKVVYETEDSLIDVKEKAKFNYDKKVIIYEARKSNISALTSFISDKIRQKYPEWIVCVIGREYGKEHKKLSIRLEQTKRKENLVEILEKVKKDVPTVKGGGHKSAIGVSVSQEYLDDFLESFLSFI
ncbi:MAG: DHHA1 domain-containing protein [Candidatus Aenigmatarchaeota archaeon]